MSEIKTANRIMRIYLETVESIVGYNGLKSILNYGHLEKYINSFPPDNDRIEIPEKDLRNLHLSLIELFGHKGVRSLQLRVGRESVRRGLEKLPHIARAMQFAALLVPEPRKMRIGLEKMMETVKQRSIYPSEKSSEPFLELKEEKDWFIFIYRDYWESKDVVSQQPVCGILAGIIEAIMGWITGHLHQVEEIECKAMGHPADVFRIAKARKKE